MPRIPKHSESVQAIEGVSSCGLLILVFCAARAAAEGAGVAGLVVAGPARAAGPTELPTAGGSGRGPAGKHAHADPDGERWPWFEPQGAWMGDPGLEIVTEGRIEAI